MSLIFLFWIGALCGPILGIISMKEKQINIYTMILVFFHNYSRLCSTQLYYYLLMCSLDLCSYISFGFMMWSIHDITACLVYTHTYAMLNNACIGTKSWCMSFGMPFFVPSSKQRVKVTCIKLSHHHLQWKICGMWCTYYSRRNWLAHGSILKVL